MSAFPCGLMGRLRDCLKLGPSGVRFFPFKANVFCVFEVDIQL
jgi:hypothetical protein